MTSTVLPSTEVEADEGTGDERDLEEEFQDEFEDSLRAEMIRAGLIDVD